MTPKKRLGEMLIDAGVIDATQLQAALGFQRQWGVRLGQALVDLKLATEPQITEALARKFGFGVARLDALDPYALQQALKLVPGEFAARNVVLPMAADTGTITVAMSDPTNLSVVDELSFRTGRRVKVQIGGEREIAAALKRHYPGARKAVEAIDLDLEADDGGSEPLHDPFGGGSNDALEAFFGSAPRPPQAPAAVVATTPAASRAGTPARDVPAPPPAAQPVELAPEIDVTVARESLLGSVPEEGLAELDPADLSPADPEPEPEPTPPAPPIAATAPPAIATPPPAVPPAPPAPASASAEARGYPDRPLTDRELAILDELDRLAGGAHADPTVVKPAQAMAALIRLLIRRGIVGEHEFLDELLRK